MLRILPVLLLFFCAGSVTGQTLIRGIVVDSATFSGIANVNIQVKGKFRGTTTDGKGNFAIQASTSDTLVLTLVGYNRVELPLYDYEAGMIRMSEKQTMLAPIVIHDSRLYANPYEGLFDDQAAALKKKIPFYFSKARKDKVKAANWREESLRVQTYIDVVINNTDTKEGLMKKYNLSEKEYYDILTQFNEKHYQVMYFLTAGELTSLINRFFEYTAAGR